MVSAIRSFDPTIIQTNQTNCLKTVQGEELIVIKCDKDWT